LADRHPAADHFIAGYVLAVAMLKSKPDFIRPVAIPRAVRREQQAAEGLVAMADYKKARAAVLERMLELRAARLRQQFNSKES
jgi:hypothetical protein